MVILIGYTILKCMVKGLYCLRKVKQNKTKQVCTNTSHLGQSSYYYYYFYTDIQKLTPSLQ